MKPKLGEIKKREKEKNYWKAVLVCGEMSHVMSKKHGCF
jgi:hypothetical protein